MAIHEQSVGKTDEWYTPPHVFDALGCRFHTDVASRGRDVTPWIPADHFITKAEPDDWCGFIWMNPPFGGRNGIAPWLERFFKHGNGIALTPDRTSAPWWQRFARSADNILFVAPKLHFIRPDGTLGKQPGQGTCLMAIGERAIDALNMAHFNRLGLLVTPSSEPRRYRATECNCEPWPDECPYCGGDAPLTSRDGP